MSHNGRHRTLGTRNRAALLLAGAVCLGLLPSGCGRGAARSPIGPAAQPPASTIRLVDHARGAGLNYTFAIAGPRPATILQTIGNGCAFLDYDRDGDLDVLLVGSSGPKLYRGDGRGHFTDVTTAAGLTPRLPAVPGAAWLGCAVGDIDNDGYPDIYLSGYRTAALYRNEHGSRFVDVTHKAGIHPEPWGTSCGFADLDGDGRLDLFVCNYVQFGLDPRQYPQNCDLGVLTGCGPLTYRPERPTLYHNEGGGRFRDVSASSGVRRAGGKGLGVAFSDYDGDGRTDILVANDLMPGDLFHNEGGMRFTNRGLSSGTALSPDGRPHGGMGADWADAEGSGRLDAVVATFENEPKSLYRNMGGGVFTDDTHRAGLDADPFSWVSFGVKWLDLDNDGRPDLIFANGHVYDNADQLHTARGSGLYRQPLQILRNLGPANGGVTFQDISTAALGGAPPRLVGRGLAVGDYDNDGRIDALVVDAEGPPLLLHNEGDRTCHWLGLSLIGTSRSNRDALGARVTVRAGGRRWVKEVQTAGSYLSSSDKRLLFGLGRTARVQSVTVRWPDGRVETRFRLPADRYVPLTEGQRETTRTQVHP